MGLGVRGCVMLCKLVGPRVAGWQCGIFGIGRAGSRDRDRDRRGKREEPPRVGVSVV